MKKALSAILKYGIPIGISVGLAWYLYTNVDLDAIVTSMRQDVNYWWFVPVIVVSIFSHIFRALRWRFIGFLSVVGLLCVAASSYYRTEAAPLHYVGGILCALCATVVTAIINPLLLLGWLLYLIEMLIAKWRNWCFWGEVLVFVLLVAALIR